MYHKKSTNTYIYHLFFERAYTCQGPLQKSIWTKIEFVRANFFRN